MEKNEPSTSFDQKDNLMESYTDSYETEDKNSNDMKFEENILKQVHSSNKELVDNKPIENQSIEEVNTESEEIKYFKCYLCQLEERYDYYGNEPPFVKKFLMEEDCYMIEDPFVAPRKREFLTLGSNCSVCNQPVCKDPECSFYYLKTYCMKCLKKNEKKFPEFLHEKIKKILK